MVPTDGVQPLNLLTTRGARVAVPRDVPRGDTVVLLLGTRALARFFLDDRHHFDEAFHIVRSHAAADGLFQIDEVPMDAFRRLHASGGGRDHERPAIRGADFARDQTAVRQPIKNARERGALVREAAVQFGDRRGCGRCEQREDVRFTLRQAILTQIGQVETDPVRRSMNVWNQAQ